jgi:hypothetical protein
VLEKAKYLIEKRVYQDSVASLKNPEISRIESNRKLSDLLVTTKTDGQDGLRSAAAATESKRGISSFFSNLRKEQSGGISSGLLRIMCGTGMGAVIGGLSYYVISERSPSTAGPLGLEIGIPAGAALGAWLLRKPIPVIGMFIMGATGYLDGISQPTYHNHPWPWAMSLGIAGAFLLRKPAACISAAIVAAAAGTLGWFENKWAGVIEYVVIGEIIGGVLGNVLHLGGGGGDDGGGSSPSNAGPNWGSYMPDPPGQSYPKS